MSLAPQTLTDTLRPPPEDPADALAREHLALLREMREMGMDLARKVWRQGMTQPDEPVDDGKANAPPRVDHSLIYARITRAVRLTMALEARVLAEMTARRARAQEAAAGDETTGGAERVRARIAAVLADRDPSTRRVKTAKRAVEQAARDQIADGETLDRLIDDLRERSDDEVPFLNADNRSVADLIDEACRLFGLIPDCDRWKPDEWEGQVGAEGPECSSKPAHPREGGDPGFFHPPDG